MCIHDLKPLVSLLAKTDMFPLFQTVEIKPKYLMKKIEMLPWQLNEKQIGILRSLKLKQK